MKKALEGWKLCWKTKPTWPGWKLESLMTLPPYTLYGPNIKLGVPSALLTSWSISWYQCMCLTSRRCIKSNSLGKIFQSLQKFRCGHGTWDMYMGLAFTMCFQLFLIMLLQFCFVIIWTDLKCFPFPTWQRRHSWTIVLNLINISRSFQSATSIATASVSISKLSCTCSRIQVCSSIYM